jgi:hypothetical protein
MITLSVAALLTGFPFCAFSAQSEGPSLSETLAWMDSTYNPHSNGGSWGHGRREIYGSGKLLSNHIASFEYDGCSMIITVTEDPIDPIYNKDYPSISYKFNLGDIDPVSLRTIKSESWYGGIACNIGNDSACDLAEIDFQTHNQLPLIERDYPNSPPEFRGVTHTMEADFILDDIPYSVRFARAFRHAVELCGGKPSTF